MSSTTTLTPENLFNQLLNEICTEIAFKTFQKHININSICLHCHQQCELINEKPGLDIYGNKIDSNGGVISSGIGGGVGGSSNNSNSTSTTVDGINVECPCCKKTLAATRFAPHLEKCMGMGRQSARKRGSNLMMKMAAGSDNDSADDSFDQSKTATPSIGAEETFSQSSQTASKAPPTSLSGNEAKKAKTASPSKAKSFTATAAAAANSKNASPSKSNSNNKKATTATAASSTPSRSKSSSAGKK